MKKSFLFLFNLLPYYLFFFWICCLPEFILVEFFDIDFFWSFEYFGLKSMCFMVGFGIYFEMNKEKKRRISKLEIRIDEINKERYKLQNKIEELEEIHRNL